jgi:hypothetical protein
MQTLASQISGGALTNNALLAGTGRISSVLVNQSTGQISLGAGDVMQFSAAGNTNSGGTISLGGGTVQFTRDLTNSGTISGRGTISAGTLNNNGTLQCSEGFTDVYGSVNNNNRITVTGGSTTTFYGNISIGPVGSITVNAASTVVFLGNLSGQSKVTGPGTKDFEGVATGGPIATVVGDTLVGAPATVTADYLREDDLQVFGSLGITPNGTSASISKVNTLSIAGGKLDLTDNDLIVSNTPVTTIAGYIKSAYDLGSWNDKGLTSSAAQSQATGAHPTALGYASASSIGVGSFDGQTVGGPSVLIRYTYAGDANLDGVVNALDFNAIATNFGAESGKFWSQGDFNYDGISNTLDFTALARDFELTLGSPALGTLVPEPSVLALLASAAALAVRRVRRANRHRAEIPTASPRCDEAGESEIERTGPT